MYSDYQGKSFMHYYDENIVPQIEPPTPPGAYGELYETVEATDLERFQDTFFAAWNTWKIVSFFLSVAVLAGVLYSIVRYNQVRAAQKKKLESLTVESAGAAVMNERWKSVLDHIGSHNESDWRLAILEADIMLDEMMTAMGYTQETLGEKLKAVEGSDMRTLDKAWEAHKVRNNIAHQGAEFNLDEREVRRVIELYKDVFEEFHYI